MTWADVDDDAQCYYKYWYYSVTTHCFRLTQHKVIILDRFTMISVLFKLFLRMPDYYLFHSTFHNSEDICVERKSWLLYVLFSTCYTKLAVCLFFNANYAIQCFVTIYIRMCVCVCIINKSIARWKNWQGSLHSGGLMKISIEKKRQNTA